ncbi:PEGA domain-containing protein [Butyrivibrio sp. XPD2002]|uniref:PEGA domain-containing protein n=1 Tax=Butyrivibrio sp. XPD2002 TaxID=1280665 RepID=UPI000417795F|nr:PEGA domain-containing protein [Butyrivibrio sp. XPD2002]
MKNKFQRFFILLLAVAFTMQQPLSVCATESVITEDAKVRVSLLGKYDSADTASVKQVNTYSKTIQFRNHDIGKNYTLSYDNTSMIYDIHGRPMSASRLEVGQVVDITFLKGVKHLNSLIISDDAWVEEEVNNFDLVSDDETAKVNGTVFHITPKTLIISDGQSVNPEDILMTDTIRVSGIDKEIYSIVVTRGHGYVSLSSDRVNDRSLVGAWIELDKEVIRKITPNMLISAPEGNYNVSILGNGAKFSSEIVVNRNEETVIDTSVAEVEPIKEGNVTFVVTPSTARIFVDGDEILSEVPYTFTYGKHKLHVMAEGYEPQDHTLKVAEPNATLFIDLEPKDGTGDSSDEASSDEVTSGDAAGDYSSEPYDYSRYNVSDGNASDTASTKKKNSSKSSSSASSGTTAGVDSEAATTVAASDDDDEDDDSDSSDGNKGSGAATTGDGSSSSSSGSSEEDVLIGYKVTFDAPIGAEAYFDGNYVGIMPVSFAKTPGKHMVTLQKDGYETKSYTIQIDKEKSNVTYSFPALVPVKKDEGSDDSGNADTGSDSADEDKTSEPGGTDEDPAEVSGGEP